jgi:hypothetical protein
MPNLQTASLPWPRKHDAAIPEAVVDSPRSQSFSDTAKGGGWIHVCRGFRRGHRETLQQSVVAVQEEHLSHLFDEVSERHGVHLAPGCVIEKTSVRIVGPGCILSLRDAAHAAHGDLTEDTIHGPRTETVLLKLSRGIPTGEQPV